MAPQPAADLTALRYQTHSGLAAVSRGLVQLMRNRAGRGPTQAKTFLAGGDAVLVLLGGGYTKAEKTLWSHGQPGTAVSYRQAVLDALENEMREVVEDALGRSVEAVMTTAHHDPDVIAVVFLLDPLGGSGSGESARWDAGATPASQPRLAQGTTD